MEDTNFRAFIAIDIPEDIKKIISRATKPLREHRESKKISWTKSKNLHLTLCFLGEIANQQYQAINKEIKKSSKTFKPFKINLTTLEPFPSARKLHALVLTPHPIAPLKKLALSIKSGVTTCGIEVEDREFKPHITLGRINSKHKINSGIFTKTKLPAMHFEVTAIKLFKSEPKPDGSVYTPIAIYSLAK